MSCVGCTSQGQVCHTHRAAWVNVIEVEADGEGDDVSRLLLSPQGKGMCEGGLCTRAPCTLITLDYPCSPERM